jgi:biotin carboxylase
MTDGVERFLCIASYEKGHDFLRQCAEMGVKPTLLTLEKHRDADWPHEALEEVVTMPQGLNREQILNTVSWMARDRRFDRVVALGEFDLETAAEIREHMRVPGMGITTAGYYLDKLAMRVSAKESGFLVPEFCRVLNYDELRDFTSRVRGPWLLKPRSEASSLSIQKIEKPEQLWPALDVLGDRQSHFLLEQFVPGEIFHVDSILSECEVVFSALVRRGRLPRKEKHEGEVFTASTVDRASSDWHELTALNRGLAPTLGMVRGVTHAEYVRSHNDGRYYFLQIAARVGEEFTAELIEVSSGVNLWREWARLEVANLRGLKYALPESFLSYAGSILCRSLAVEPDTNACNDPEIVLRMKKQHQAGLIVRAEKPERVKKLLDNYSGEFARRFLVPPPPPELPEE